MIDYDKEILSGLGLLIDSWSVASKEDITTFSKGIKAGLEIARAYILTYSKMKESKKGIEDD